MTKHSEDGTDLPLSRSANDATAARRCGDAITASLCRRREHWSSRRVVVELLVERVAKLAVDGLIESIAALTEVAVVKDSLRSDERPRHH